MDPAYVELVNSLESNKPQVVEDAKKQFHNFFNSVKESWLMHGMFDLYMTTNSERIVDIFVGVREPHEQYLFDKLSDSIKGSQKIQSLELLCLIVKRSPTWMYKVVRHQLMKDLLRVLKTENEMVPLMSALLPLIMLLPTVPGNLTQSLLTEIFEVFSRLAAWTTLNPAQVPTAQLLHLQVGLFSLFNRLYGMYPVNFVHYLKSTYSSHDSTAVFNQTIKPMIESVRMHPLLVTGSKGEEVIAARLKEMEPHDVLVECSKMAVLPSTPAPTCDSWPVRPDDSSSFRSSTDFSPAPNFGEGYGSGILSRSRPLVEDTWSPTVFMTNNSPPASAPTSIPHTPISQLQPYIVSSVAPHQEGTSPPEAAVEATPESTPVKDLRTSSREPIINSSIAVNLSASLAESWQPSSPLRKDTNYFRYPPASPLLSSVASLNSGPPESPATIPPLSQMSLQAAPRQNHYASQKLTRLHIDRNTQLEQVSRLSPNESSDQEDREVEATMSLAHTSTPTTRIPGSVREDWSHPVPVLDSSSVPALPMKNIIGFSRRMRCVSNCVPESKPSPLAFGSSLGDSSVSSNEKSSCDVRRAISCPEMKKTDGESLLKSKDRPSFLKSALPEETAYSLNGLPPANTAGKKEERETVDGWCQTEEFLGHGYEQLFPSVVGTEPLGAPLASWWHPDCPGPLSPRAAVEQYIEQAAVAGGESELKAVKAEMALVLLELSVERHRRRMHAERNRRLSGKSRDWRALEEHNAALRNKVSLLEGEIKELRTCVKTLRGHGDADKRAATCQRALDKCAQLEKENSDWKSKIASLEEDLERQRELNENKAREWRSQHARLFDLESSMHSAILSASTGKVAAEEVARLNARLLSAGESEVRLIGIIQRMTIDSKKAAEVLLSTETFNHQLQKVREDCDAISLRLEAERAASNDFEAELARKDQEIEELRITLHKAADASAAALSERDAKISHLRQLISSKEEETIGLLARIETAEAAQTTGTAIKRPQNSPPLSASLSSSGTLSLSGTEPAPIKNLQLLLDSTTDHIPAGPSGTGANPTVPPSP